MKAYNKLVKALRPFGAARDANFVGAPYQGVRCKYKEKLWPKHKDQSSYVIVSP